jgi:hypothetical protein
MQDNPNLSQLHNKTSAEGQFLYPDLGESSDKTCTKALCYTLVVFLKNGRI